MAESKRSGKWNPEFYVTAYELARNGLNDLQIAKTLGVSQTVIRVWKTKKPAFRSAIERGRKSRTENHETATGFHHYVYNRLPPDLKKLWIKIRMIEEDEPNGIELVESLLRDQGKVARQHLFMYALTTGNFSVPYACQCVNISRSTFHQWCTEDPDFTALFREVLEYKKDFFENALVRLVAAGSESATIFANRTLNRDRGYGDKVQVEHTGEIKHKHITIDELDLPVEVRIQILEAMKRRQQAIDVTPNPAGHLYGPHSGTTEFERSGRERVVA